MKDTGIIWTESTWNPVSGCQKISQGCKFCYAHTIAEKYRGTPAYPNGFDVTYRPHKLKMPHTFKEPRMFFVNSMSDFFWDKITDDYRDQMLQVMIDTPRHEYQVLTKRPEKMVEYFKTRKVPFNFWAGVTIEDQDNIGRLHLLQEVDASIRFISMEPLISSVNLKAEDLSGVHWVITGGESGHHLFDQTTRDKRAIVDYSITTKKWTPRPDRIDWIRDIRDACIDNGISFFHKQWGGWKPESAGRILDGRTWNEMPRYPGGNTELNNDYLKLLESKTTV